MSFPYLSLGREETAVEPAETSENDPWCTSVFNLECVYNQTNNIEWSKKLVSYLEDCEGPGPLLTDPLNRNSTMLVMKEGETL